MLGTAVGPVHLALACLLDQPDDPWFVASDEPTDARTDATSTVCASILKAVSVTKNRAAISSTSVNSRRPKRLSRLILILAMTTLHLTSLGVGVVGAEKRRFVDPHWERRMSYLKLGWRWRRQQDQRRWQAFPPFWLDPAPDPFPVLASHRTVLGGSHGVDLPMAV
jgi:hypothetical protein